MKRIGQLAVPEQGLTPTSLPRNPITMGKSYVSLSFPSWKVGTILSIPQGGFEGYAGCEGLCAAPGTLQSEALG